MNTQETKKYNKMTHEISTLHTFILEDFTTKVSNKVKEILLSSLYDTNNLISDITSELYNKLDESTINTLDKGHDYDYYWIENDKEERTIVDITEYVSHLVQSQFNNLLSREKTAVTRG